MPTQHTAYSGGHRTGSANLPLHGGKAPAWLFQRMVKLGREMTRTIVEDYGPEEVLRRLSDPYWFQALGCVLGFDWHSSGVTTTVCGALKEGLKDIDGELGLYIVGGKGRTSRRTPDELEEVGERTGLDAGPLVRLSRMTAKVDNTAVQDGYQLYHHVFLVTRSGSWAVVQQGMSDATGYARRYHWLGEKVTDLVDEPHAGIISVRPELGRRTATLNFVAHESAPTRDLLPQLVSHEHPHVLAGELEKLQTLTMPHRHHVLLQDINPRHFHKTIPVLHDRQPQTFEDLLGLEGVGPKTLRALGLIAELVHGTPLSARDPARFSFAHGGKDGHPFPVDRPTYDQSIAFLRASLDRSRVDASEKREALRRLGKMESEQNP